MPRSVPMKMHEMTTLRLSPLISLPTPHRGARVPKAVGDGDIAARAVAAVHPDFSVISHPHAHEVRNALRGGINDAVCVKQSVIDDGHAAHVYVFTAHRVDRRWRTVRVT
jgi:hypothetical protein